MRGRRGPPGGRVQAGGGAARVPIPSVERRGRSPGRSSEGAPDACGTAETRGRPGDARRRVPGRAGTPPERPEDARKTPAEACPGAESGLPESGASSSASSASAPREAALVPASTPWSIPAGCWNAPQGHGRGLSTPGCMPSGRPANWASWFLILIFVNKNAELFLTETRFFMGFRASVLRHLSYV